MTDSTVTSPQPAHTSQVVTYATDEGSTMDICTDCDKRLTAAHDWPKDSRGREYCQVMMGRHRGHCEVGE